jgi:diguanylate cyclase (GGDEF)-like protein
VIGTFLVYCLRDGGEERVATAINIALVGTVILKVLYDSFAAFIELERSQEALLHERRAAERLSDENFKLANTDALTGLPNRRQFFAELERLMTPREDGPAAFTMGVLDLDGFKPVNDTYGHSHGDRLLTAIGDRLRGTVSERIMVARLGGDEFGVIIRAPAGDATGEGQRLCDLVRQPVAIGDTTVSVGCSAGLAHFPDAGSDAHQLFDRADFALYRAKSQHRGGCIAFSPELEQMIRSGQVMEAALQAADLERELSLVFQPVFATAAVRIVAVEALARWHSPQLGAVRPDLFIPVAEQLGIARKMTRVLFDKAVTVLATLPEPIRMTFNLSPADLADPLTIDLLVGRLAASGLSPTRLVFEITENALITDIHAARTMLERLRATGARLALDDFGTGYSSLSTLHQLPFDIVKVDRSFAVRLADDVGRRLVAAIRGLARSLSLECVIEGIETEAQLIEATLSGFEYAQGFFLGRPVAVDELHRAVAAEPLRWRA